jgi:nanoRNase/pAp phosphatase (c-di-AMP/oligoRNAs hydrolase)
MANLVDWRVKPGAPVDSIRKATRTAEEQRHLVVGHINPDTDSIASAMGYAGYCKIRDTTPSPPVRAPESTDDLGAQPPGH